MDELEVPWLKVLAVHCGLDMLQTTRQVTQSHLNPFCTRLRLKMYSPIDLHWLDKRSLMFFNSVLHCSDMTTNNKLTLFLKSKRNSETVKHFFLWLAVVCLTEHYHIPLWYIYSKWSEFGISVRNARVRELSIYSSLWRVHTVCKLLHKVSLSWTSLSRTFFSFFT